MKFISNTMLLCILFMLSMTSSFASENLHKGFVYLHNIDNSIKQDLGFAKEGNCMAARLDGYQGSQVICTLPLAKELKKVQKALKKINPNYSLLVLDAYRPARAVEHIKRWAADLNEQSTKERCYPDIDKKDLPGKYVAAKRSSHSRGSTVDIIIMDIKTGERLDFGPVLFGDYAHFNYKGLTEVQRSNRMMLRDLMLKHNFKPYDAEFWHFTLKGEPFPETYFDFPIKDE